MKFAWRSALSHVKSVVDISAWSRDQITPSTSVGAFEHTVVVGLKTFNLYEVMHHQLISVTNQLTLHLSQQHVELRGLHLM